jgi:hypothetical protein
MCEDVTPPKNGCVRTPQYTRESLGVHQCAVEEVQDVAKWRSIWDGEVWRVFIASRENGGMSLLIVFLCHKAELERDVVATSSDVVKRRTRQLDDCRQRQRLPVVQPASSIMFVLDSKLIFILDPLSQRRDHLYVHIMLTVILVARLY